MVLEDWVGSTGGVDLDFLCLEEAEEEAAWLEVEGSEAMGGVGGGYWDRCEGRNEGRGSQWTRRSLERRRETERKKN